MSSAQEMLKEQVDKSIELTTKMLANQEGLETKIKDLEAKGLGSADLKEQVQKMATDNAKAIDEIKRLTEEAKKELHDRQDEFETKFAGGRMGGDGAPVDVAAPFIKAVEASGLSRATKGRDLGAIKASARDFVAKMDFASLVSQKAITALSGSAGPALIPGYEPTIQAPGQQQVTLLDVLPRSTTEDQIVYWIREKLASRTNGVNLISKDYTGTGQASTALGTSAFVFEQANEQVRTGGTIVPIALQVLDDIGQMRGYIDNQLRYMVRYFLEGQVLNGDNTGINFNGLNTQASAYDATLDNTVGVEGLQKLDVLRLAIMQVALAFIPADTLLMSPYDVVGLELMKTASEKSYMLVNPNSSNTLRPWGVPVIQTTQQAQDTFTALAMSRVELVFRKDIEIMLATENATDFEKYMGTIRAVVRAMLKVYRPESIVKGTFAAALA